MNILGDDLQRIPSFLNGGGVGVGAGTDGSNTSLGSSSRLDRFRAAIPQARPDVPEDWNFPLVAPGLPDRAYLLFQQVSCQERSIVVSAIKTNGFICLLWAIVLESALYLKCDKMLSFVHTLLSLY